MKLKPCPCGKTPKLLYIEEATSCKWAYVYGDCCSQWHVEFRTGYKPLDSEECIEFAIKKWNESPRGSDI